MAKSNKYTLRLMFWRNFYFFLFLPVVAWYGWTVDRYFLLGFFAGSMFILFPLDRLLWVLEVDMSKSEAEIRAETVYRVADRMIKDMEKTGRTRGWCGSCEAAAAAQVAEEKVNQVRVERQKAASN